MIATVPCVPLVTAVMVRPAFSKVSLVSRFAVSLPSSATVCVSAAMSTTALTVSLITCAWTLPSPSCTLTVKVSAPL